MSEKVPWKKDQYDVIMSWMKCSLNFLAQVQFWRVMLFLNLSTLPIKFELQKRKTGNFIRIGPTWVGMLGSKIGEKVISKNGYKDFWGTSEWKQISSAVLQRGVATNRDNNRGGYLPHTFDSKSWLKKKVKFSNINWVVLILKMRYLCGFFLF